MLNKPKFMIPSTNIPECTIDTNADSVIFSCAVDGNEIVTGWQIKIYRLTDNILVYDTGKITSGHNLPFYPVDANNNNVTFTVNLKDYPTLEDNLTEGKFFINQTEPYYWSIEFWGSNPTSVASNEEAFYANSTPEITIQYGTSSNNYSTLGDSAIINSRRCYFKGIYSQDEGIPLKRFGWRLTDIDTGQILIDTISKNQIYGIDSSITCFYNGFLNESSYSIELFIETQNNAVVYCKPIIFSVQYDEIELDSDISVNCLKNEPAIILSWENVNVATARAEGEISYLENYPKFVPDEVGTSSYSVHIPDSSQIIYDYGAVSELNVAEDSYITISGQLLSNTNKVLFSAEGLDDSGNLISRILAYKNGYFYYTISNGVDDPVTVSMFYSSYPSEYMWYIATLSPYLAEDTFLKLQIGELENSLYPKAEGESTEENLYPSSSSLYPSLGNWVLSDAFSLDPDFSFDPDLDLDLDLDIGDIEIELS